MSSKFFCLLLEDGIPSSKLELWEDEGEGGGGGGKGSRDGVGAESELLVVDDSKVELESLGNSAAAVGSALP